VTLQDPEQRRDVAGYVVDDLPPRRPAAAEEHPAHPDERLGIGRVLDRLDTPCELLAQPSLAADIGGCRPDWRHRPEIIFFHLEKLNPLATPAALAWPAAG
jgi:hypothetical protein